MVDTKMKTVKEHLTQSISEHQASLKKLVYLLNNLPEDMLSKPYTEIYPTL